MVILACIVCLGATFLAGFVTRWALERDERETATSERLGALERRVATDSTTFAGQLRSHNVRMSVIVAHVGHVEEKVSHVQGLVAQTIPTPLLPPPKS